MTVQSVTTNDSKPSAPVQRERHYWRSLDELADTSEFRQWLNGEFPSLAFETLTGLSRRRFLQVAAASFVLAGASGCFTQPAEKIMPAVLGESSFTPTKAEYFATTLATGGDTLGVLVKNQMGRPIKIEGNPDHPASRGATNVHAQADILNLYDPARSQAVYHKGDISKWQQFTKALQHQMGSLTNQDGAGLCIVTPPPTSPTETDQIRRILKKNPRSRWFVHDSLGNRSISEGTKLAFGESLLPVYQLAKADVVVAFDADLLGCDPGHVRHTRDLADRRVPGENANVNRLYVAEPCPTLTGSKADHRLPIRAVDIAKLVTNIAKLLQVDVGGLGRADNSELSPAQQKWAQATANDLARNKGKALVVVGQGQAPELHALAWAINAHLKALERTVVFTKPPPTPAAESIDALVDAIESRDVKTLCILDANPVYDLSAEPDFAQLLAKAPFSIHLGDYRDETARQCTWHIPKAHVLESWSDAWSYDGTVSLCQPLIRPMYNGKAKSELLALLADDDTDLLKIVQEHWKRAAEADDFEYWWRRCLKKGVIKEHGLKKVEPSLRANKRGFFDNRSEPFDANQQGSLEVHFSLDHALLDGRYALNAWLQEVPDPITKLVWGNAALIGPATAKKLGVENGQVLELSRDGRLIHAPASIVPGHADNSITLPLGYGRHMPDTIADGVGFNANGIRSRDAQWFAADLNVAPTTEHVELVSTQHHHAMEGRDFIRVVRLQGAADAGRADETGHTQIPLSLYPERDMDGQQWGMTIDLARCTGCNVCTVACQAENNIPVVGAEQVQVGREMHWIRIDRYFAGPPEAPAIHHQPVPCMHCEDAPCEVVCPVAATTHSTDGLNEMTYNRCVGTRYCSNNCPYKVRRFNFLEYTNSDSESLALQRNPDVTVRSRGVMEKCTYCVQRIRTAEIDARKENRAIRDGEVVTACQQACPAQAIDFGNINDSKSRVSATRRSSREYGLLAELNARPRTTYLAEVHNPSPEAG